MKTHEMIRDIRVGETYEVVGEETYFATCDEYGDVLYGGEKIALLTKQFLAKTWRKRTPAVTVDFAKAFVAYEKGARIKPLALVGGVEGDWYAKADDGRYIAFTAHDIRGKWIVEGPGIESGEYWWE